MSYDSQVYITFSLLFIVHYSCISQVEKQTYLTAVFLLLSSFLLRKVNTTVFLVSTYTYMYVKNRMLLLRFYQLEYLSFIIVCLI